MGDVRHVEPRDGSFVNEWRAIQFSMGDWPSVKRLLRPLGYLVFVELAETDGPNLVLSRNNTWTHMQETDWVIISPHDRVITMSNSEFDYNFIGVN
jgi:hypothetical protein